MKVEFFRHNVGKQEIDAVVKVLKSLFLTTGKYVDELEHSLSKYLGVKHHGGEKVTAGSIIVRQRGSKFHPGEGTALGRDYTLFATVDGVVIYYGRRGKQFVSVTQSS